jgi:hypothetical protein
MQDLPLKGEPKEVTESLITIIDNLIKKENVAEFYIGRAFDIITMKIQLNCDSVLLLYESRDKEPAIVIEDDLIHYFAGHAKCCNTTNFATDKNAEYKINHVYVALWYGVDGVRS